MEKLAPVSRNLVVVADNVDGEALAMLVVNKLKGNLNCITVQAPGFGDRRQAILEDMAVLFGATLISKDAGLSLDTTGVADLGRCRRVVATKDDTTFVKGAGDQAAIKARIKQLRIQVEDTTSSYDRMRLNERAGRLEGGVGIIKVGAATEVELREKKQRLEDALSATRVAIQEGIVAGGGVSLVRAAQSCLDQVRTEGEERIGVRIVADAVEAPVKLIADNAGLSGEVTLEGVRKGEGDWGFDAESKRFWQYV